MRGSDGYSLGWSEKWQLFTKLNIYKHSGFAELSCGSAAVMFGSMAFERSIVEEKKKGGGGEGLL